MQVLRIRWKKKLMKWLVFEVLSNSIGNGIKVITQSNKVAKDAMIINFER